MSSELEVKVALLLKSPTFIADLQKTAAALKLDRNGELEVLFRTAGALNLNNIIKKSGFVSKILEYGKNFITPGTRSNIGLNLGGGWGALAGGAAGAGLGMGGKQLYDHFKDPPPAPPATPEVGDPSTMAALHAVVGAEALRTGGGALGGGALGAGIGSMVDHPLLGGALGAGLGGVAGHYSREILKSLGIGQ